MSAPALAKSGTMRSTGFTIRCTSMGALVRPDRLAHQRTDAKVGHVMVVHDVEMNQVGARRDHARTSSPSRAKSADSMLGAMRYRHMSCDNRGPSRQSGYKQLAAHLPRSPAAAKKRSTLARHARAACPKIAPMDPPGNTCRVLRRDTQLHCGPVGPARTASSSPTPSRSATPAHVAGAADQPALDHHRCAQPGAGSARAGRGRRAAAAQAG